MGTRLLAAVTLACAAAATAATRPGPPPAAQDAPVFSAESELVVLQVVAEEGRHRPVAGLTADDFTVEEDGVPQPITFFSELDAPVTMGLVVDGSGSMQPLRARVAAAARAFVDASNAEDEMFALTFNESVRALLPARAPFTSDAAVLQSALESAVGSLGKTALYDAVLDGLRYADDGMFQRKVLVIVSDGGDNASMAVFDDVLDAVRLSNAVVFAVAIVDPADREARPGRLKQLAEASGGEAFELHELRDTASVLGHIARDVRSMYTLGYAPPRDGRAGFRRIHVEVHAAGHRRVHVRTRDGYLAGKR
jgi:Ca-activated chloride channel family protein